MPGSRPSRNCEVEYSTLKFQSQGTLAKLFSYFISPLHSKNPEMYCVKDKLTTQYITLADGSFVAEWQKLEGRRLTSRRKRIGERLGITWTLFLYRLPAKGALTHHRRWQVVVWPAAIVRPPGGTGTGRLRHQLSPSSICSRRQRRLAHRTPLRRCTGGFGAVGHQQAAPGIYRRIACHYYHNLSKGLNAARFGGILCSCQFDKSYFLEGVL